MGPEGKPGFVGDLQTGSKDLAGDRVGHGKAAEGSELSTAAGRESGGGTHAHKSECQVCREEETREIPDASGAKGPPTPTPQD